MNGKQFLSSATLLLNKGSGEADFRSSISRAYYACFLVTRKRLFDSCGISMIGYKKEKRIKHKSIFDYLKHSSDQAIRELGDDLVSLYGIRIDADYDMSASIMKGDANDAVQNADCFLKALLSVNDQQIKTAVEDYKNKFYSSS